MTHIVSPLFVIFLSIFIHKVYNQSPWFNNVTPSPSLPVYSNYICKNSRDYEISYDSSIPIKYYLWIHEILQDGTEVTIRFDSEPTISLTTTIYPQFNLLKLKSEPDLINNIYTFVFTNVTKMNVPALLLVMGERPPHHPPYITSLKINGEERCREPNLGFFGRGHVLVADYYRNAPDKYCGRRKLSTQKSPLPLIVAGTSANAGWWPWHAALSERRNGNTSFVGGGTLISKRLILTGIKVQWTPSFPRLLEQRTPDVLIEIDENFS